MSTERSMARRNRVRGAAGKASLLAPVVIAALAAAACSSSTPSSSTGPGPKGDSGTLVVGVSGDFENFDPCIGGSPRTTEIVASTYENPVGFKTDIENGIRTQVADDTNSWVPSLAQTIDIAPDFTSYTFHLRLGVKFTQTGNPMTADDWMWTFQRAISTPAIGFCSSDLFSAAISSMSQITEVDGEDHGASRD
jgi:peptide/nickel transport system substrate-binding protein